MNPYEDMPSREELEASGAADWIKESLGEQLALDAKLKKQLKGETRSIKAEKSQLHQLLELPPDLDPEEPAPDLFATEREKAKKERGQLPSLFDDLAQSRKADKNLLDDFFGKL